MGFMKEELERQMQAEAEKCPECNTTLEHDESNDTYACECGTFNGRCECGRGFNPEEAAVCDHCFDTAVSSEEEDDDLEENEDDDMSGLDLSEEGEDDESEDFDEDEEELDDEDDIEDEDDFGEDE